MGIDEDRNSNCLIGALEGAIEDKMHPWYLRTPLNSRGQMAFLRKVVPALFVLSLGVSLAQAQHAPVCDTLRFRQRTF